MKSIKLSTLLLTLFLSMISTDTFAYVEIGGIYYDLMQDGSAIVTSGDKKYSGDVVIPERFKYMGWDEYSVEAIDEKAFYECPNLTSVSIPNSVKRIEAKAFQNCSGLTSINIPNSVTYIGWNAFYGCSGLTSITIPNSVTSIGSETFRRCSGLTSIAIPNSVTSIGNGAFSYCSGLTSITIPNSVTSIGNQAFSGCTRLTDITIPNSVTSIGLSAFSGCTRLTDITIPNSVTSIGLSAFSDCSGLTSIKVDADNNKYDSRDNCNAIIETGTSTLISGCKNITIPNSVTNIGGSAFFGCTRLASINIPNSVTSIENSSFAGCRGLTSITIPNSVTSIGDNAFDGCSGLTDITIGNSVTSIGSGAFKGCSALKSITIPNSVTSIGSYAFASCNGMEDVCCLAEKVPTTDTYAFEYSHTQYATLYVPASAINDYKTTAPWSNFGTIKAIEGGETKKCATPTISYHNGKLTFNCETEGVEYRSSITDTDINDYTTQEINLSVTYTIKVYAMKSGCQNSDVATGTLCWIDVDPRKEGITDGVAQVKAMPVLIKSHGGQLTVEGAADDTTVSVYNAAGVEQGSAVSKNGQATISTSLEAGSVAIVKIGKRAVKVVMR